MQLNLEWSRVLPLKAEREGFYSIELSKLSTGAGIYVLGRKWGSNFEALYVGKAKNIRSRIKGQLNNLRLMQHIKQAQTGKRIVLAGEFAARPGQQLNNCLPLAERALIRHFLAEGHDLVNIHGTRLRRHEVSSTGQHPKRYFAKVIFLEK